MLTVGEIRRLLDAHGLRASRALGQHFLADPNTAERIVRLAGVRPGDRVLEIGPGVGSLTLALAAAGARVLAVERDRHVLPVLEQVVAGHGDVEVVEADAREVDYDRLLGPPPAQGAGPWTSVSNLPYNIAVPLLAHLLDDVPQIGALVVMVQREVAERLTAAPGTRVSGAISIKVAYHAETEVVGRVPSTVFLPRPKVDSALVRIVRRSRPAVAVDDPERMFRLVRAGFAQRRKTLGRALRGELGDSAPELLEAAGVEPRARAETLSVEQWAALAEVTA